MNEKILVVDDEKEIADLLEVYLKNDNYIVHKLQENTIVITFENFGNPIAEEKLKLIFEQFYRVDTSRNTTSGGAGLGLAIAKHIVELHKGTIVAHSKDECIKFIVTQLLFRLWILFYVLLLRVLLKPVPQPATKLLRVV